MSGELSDFNWRATPRKVVDWPVTLVIGRARFKARLVDVSNTGLRLSTRTARHIGETYRIELRQQEEVDYFHVLILWDYFLDDHFVSGCEMVWESPKEEERWTHWISRMPECDPEESAERAFEQRAAPRVPTNRPVLFRDRHSWVKGEFRNITEGGSGALLSVKAQSPPMDVVHFKVRIDKQLFGFRARTVWSKLVGGDYLVGVKFIEPSNEDPKFARLPRIKPALET
ncbi:MAG: PilZ domain-containing protein [Armatimonadetes bacterium]|nr:PilZ domain-containing protein [Armatimonadota bacterium]